MVVFACQPYTNKSLMALIIFFVQIFSDLMIVQIEWSRSVQVCFAENELVLYIFIWSLGGRKYVLFGPRSKNIITYCLPSGGADSLSDNMLLVL